MPYGYLGQNTPNQTVSNSGVFSISDVASLEKQGKFGGSLELIEEVTLSADSVLDFTSIQETKYDVHQLQLNITDLSESVYLGTRFYESGVLETASVYQYAEQYGYATGSFGEQKSTGQTLILSSESNLANTSVNLYMYFYNLGNSSKYSFLTFQCLGRKWSAGDFNFYFGGGVLPQASTVDGIRVFPSSGNFTGTAKLYGVKQL
jgi:hypothetical protein